MHIPTHHGNPHSHTYTHTSLFFLLTMQEDIVKLQTVNLAAKLCIANVKQSKLLCQYVLNLAKYDMNYDVRDRARFLQRLVLPSDVSGTCLACDMHVTCM